MHTALVYALAVTEATKHIGVELSQYRQYKITVMQTNLRVKLPFSGFLSGGANQAVTRTPAVQVWVCLRACCCHICIGQD